VNLAEKGGLLVEPNTFEPMTMKNPPELTVPSMAAPDASSITARLKPTYRLPLDPKLTAVLIQEKQYGLLETLMNKPQLSPPSGIVNTDDSGNLGNMSLDNLPAEIDGNEQTDPVAIWCQLSYQLHQVNPLLERSD
jgi:hypothetical protein